MADTSNVPADSDQLHREAEAAMHAADDLSKLAEKLMHDAMLLAKVARKLPDLGPHGRTMIALNTYRRYKQGYHDQVAEIVADLEASCSPEMQTRREKARENHRKDQEKWARYHAAKDAQDALRSGEHWKPGGYDWKRLISASATHANRVLAAAKLMQDGTATRRVMLCLADIVDPTRPKLDWLDLAIYAQSNGDWEDPQPAPLPDNVVSLDHHRA